jgi:hypothetical protein
MIANQQQQHGHSRICNPDPGFRDVGQESNCCRPCEKLPQCTSETTHTHTHTRKRRCLCVRRKFEKFQANLESTSGILLWVAEAVYRHVQELHVSNHWLKSIGLNLLRFTYVSQINTVELRITRRQRQRYCSIRTQSTAT